MQLAKLFGQFEQHYPNVKPEKWLMDKLMFNEQESHSYLQTAAGAWERFNVRTRMMKGLFNYETAYRQYTRLFIEKLLQVNVQYVEIRLNFMSNNQLYLDLWSVLKRTLWNDFFGAGFSRGSKSFTACHGPSAPNWPKLASMRVLLLYRNGRNG